MNIKSTSDLRKWIKNVKARDYSNYTDENFIGSYHGGSKNGKKGFFQIFHGIKPDIAAYLPSILKIAEDGQAIYEFIQNAVDCGSTKFWIYYDEEHFLAVNNGHPFKKDEIASILNIAQSEKRNLSDVQRCDKIGRFGIGFKLVHRLVGENDGTTELTTIENGTYKGPILFSWSHYNQFSSFLSAGAKVKQVHFDKNMPNPYNESPWLFKILLTNFPAAPGEQVKDLKYNPFIAFPIEEMQDMQSFIRQTMSPVISNKGILSKGTAFFLKLGKNKCARLDEENNQLLNGVQYTLNILAKLTEVTINDTIVTKNEIEFREYEIEKDTVEFRRINPEYAFCPIKIWIGYHTEIDKIIRLKSSPNFFKYFPLGDEVDQLAFVIHSDAFDIEANRRKLHKSERNIELLNAIQSRLLDDLDLFCKRDKKRYLPLFLSILLSENQSDDKLTWINEAFTANLFQFIKTKVPTVSNRLLEKHNVIVKAFNFDINLNDVGMSQKDWFLWSGKEHQEILSAAESKEKLALEKWHLRHLIINTESSILESYLGGLPVNTYTNLIYELSNEDLTKELRSNLNTIKWIRTTKGDLVSIAEIQDGTAWATREFDYEIHTIFDALGKDTIDLSLIGFQGYLTQVNPEYYTRPAQILMSLKNIPGHDLQTKIPLDKRYKLISYIASFPEMGKDVFQFPFAENANGALCAPGHLIFNETIPLGYEFKTIILNSSEMEFVDAHNFRQLFVSEEKASYFIHSNGEMWDKLKATLIKETLPSFYKSIIEIHRKRDLRDADNSISAHTTAVDDGNGKLLWESNSLAFYLSAFSKLTPIQYSELELFMNEYSNSKLPQFNCLQYLAQIGRTDSPDTLTSMLRNGSEIPKDRFDFFIDLSSKVGKGKIFYDVYVTEQAGRVRIHHKTKDISIFNFYSNSEDEGEFTLDGVEFRPFRSKLNKEILYNQGLLNKSEFGSYIVKYANKLTVTENNFVLQSDIKTKLLFLKKLETITFSIEKPYTEEDPETKLIYILDELAKYATKNKDVAEHESIVKEITEELTRFRNNSNIGTLPIRTCNFQTEITLKAPLYSSQVYSFAIAELGIGNHNNIVAFQNFRNALSVVENEAFNRVFRPYRWDIRKDIYENLLNSDSSLTIFQGVFILIFASLNQIKPDVSKLPSFEQFTEEEKIQFMDYIFDENRRNIIPLKLWPGIEKELNIDRLIAETDLAMEDEKAAPWLIHWISLNETKRQFLEDSGIFGTDKNISLLRKIIKDGTFGDSAPLDMLEKCTDVRRLYWTVQWMAEQNIIPSGEMQLQFTQRMIDKSYSHFPKLSKTPCVLVTNPEANQYEWAFSTSDKPIFRINNIENSYKESVVTHICATGKQMVDHYMSPKHDEKLNIIEYFPELKRNADYINTHSKNIEDAFEIDWAKENDLQIKILPETGALYELFFQDSVIQKTFSKDAFKEGDTIYFVRDETRPLVFLIEPFLTESQRLDFFKRLHTQNDRQQPNKKKIELEERYSSTFEKAIKDRLDLSKEEQKQIYDAAFEIGCGYLLENGYTFPKDEGDFISQFSVKLEKTDGKTETFIFSSAVNGLLFLAPKKLLEMHQKKHSLIVIYPELVIKRFHSIEQIINDPANKFLLLRTENTKSTDHFMRVVNEKLGDNAHFIFATSENMRKSLFSMQSERIGKEPVNDIVTDEDGIDYDVT